jgi:hypothetical protein
VVVEEVLTTWHRREVHTDERVAVESRYVRLGPLRSDVRLCGRSRYSARLR